MLHPSVTVCHGEVQTQGSPGSHRAIRPTQLPLKMPVQFACGSFLPELLSPSITEWRRHPPRWDISLSSGHLSGMSVNYCRCGTSNRMSATSLHPPYQNPPLPLFQGVVALLKSYFNMNRVLFLCQFQSLSFVKQKSLPKDQLLDSNFSEDLNMYKTSSWKTLFQGLFCFVSGTHSATSCYIPEIQINLELSGITSCNITLSLFKVNHCIAALVLISDMKGMDI